MKKIVVAFLLLSLSLTLIQSCKKENETFEKESVIAPDYKYKAYVKNDMLVFDNMIDFEHTINQLNNMGDDNLNKFEDYLSYNSLRSVKTEAELENLGIEDMLLATLLNPNSEIQIGENVIKIDIIKEKAYIINKNDYVNTDSFSNTKLVKVYSIYDYIDEKGEVVQEEKSTYCEYNKKGPYQLVTASNEYKYKIVYQNAFIYKSLLAKIKYNNGSVPENGTSLCYIETIGSNYYENNDDYVNFSTNGLYYSGENHKVAYRIYYNPKRLIKYYFSVKFYAETISNYPDIPSDIQSNILTISCNQTGGGGSSSIVGGAPEIE